MLGHRVDMKHSAKVRACLLVAAALWSASALTLNRALPLASVSDMASRFEGNGVVGLLVFAAVAALFRYAETRRVSPAHAKAATLIAAVLACVESIGYNIDRYSSFLAPDASRLYGLVDVAFVAIGYFFLIAATLRVVVSFVAAYEVQEREAPRWVSLALHGKRSVLRIAAIMLVCWLPYFILLFPGVVTGDTYDQISQVFGFEPLSDNNPLASTLFLSITMHFGQAITGGTINDSVPFAVFGQMLAVSFIMAVAVKTIGAKQWRLQVICLAYFALSPLVAWYSVTLWKDVIFSAFIMLLGVAIGQTRLAGAVTDGEGAGEGKAAVADCAFDARRAILTFVALLGVLLFKKNGIYIAVPTMIVWIVLSPGLRKRISLVFIGALCTYAVMYGVAFNVLGVEKGLLREAFSLPLQQVACTIADDSDCLDASEASLVAAVLPLEELPDLYYAKCSNNVKDRFEADAFKGNAAQYAVLYLKLGLTHPLSYTKAFLAGTSGYWYPETRYWTFASSSYVSVLDNVSTYSSAVYDPDRFSYERSEGDNLARQKAADALTGLKNVPVLSILLSIGSWTWAYVITFAFLSKRRKVELAPLYALVGMVFVTCLISPVYAEARYAYALALLLPYTVYVAAFTRRKIL